MFRLLLIESSRLKNGKTWWFQRFRVKNKLICWSVRSDDRYEGIGALFGRSTDRMSKICKALYKAWVSDGVRHRKDRSDIRDIGISLVIYRIGFTVQISPRRSTRADSERPKCCRFDSALRVRSLSLTTNLSAGMTTTMTMTMTTTGPHCELWD